MIIIKFFKQKPEHHYYLDDIRNGFKYFDMVYDKDKNPVQIEYGDLSIVGFIISENQEHIIFANVDGNHETLKILNKEFIIEISPIFATPQNNITSHKEHVMFQ